MAVVLPGRLTLALLAAACASAVGCGPKGPAFVDTVEGTLTQGKQPLVGVRVQFVPQLGPNVRAPLSSATTDEKGFFRLLREDTGTPGAAVGKHKVVLLAGRIGGGERSRDEPDGSIRFSSSVPRTCTSVSTTPLEVEIKPGQTTYPLALE